MRNNNDYNNGQAPFNGQAPYNGQAPFNGQAPYNGQTPYAGQQNTAYNVPPGGYMPGAGVWMDEEELSRAVNSSMTRVFVRMFLALVVTAAAAFWVVSSPTMLTLIFTNSLVYWGLLLVEIGLVFAISKSINKLSPVAANVLFFTFAAVNGLTLSAILFVYTLGVVYHAFAVAAMMFGAMALYGMIAKTDLTKIGSICMMAVIGIIIASVVNWFLSSSTLDSIICYVGVVVFVGLTAYDTQRIKRMLEAANAANGEQAIKQISVIGALTLYLDFINMFLFLVRILGKRN